MRNAGSERPDPKPKGISAQNSQQHIGERFWACSLLTIGNIGSYIFSDNPAQESAPHK